MRKLLTGSAIAMCVMGASLQAVAGNKDRVGQAGATELLINPWGQSTGVFGLNTAQVKGIEGFKTNIAGLAFVEKTEVGVAYSRYLSGSGVGVNNLGLGQKLGDFGVIGVNVMSVSFGDIPITDFNNPEGQIGTFTPQFFNISLGFAKSFSEKIHAGIAGTFVSEQISNVKASGAAFEAGIQYVTGQRDNFHFGITLRNLGTNMKFTGSGFAVESEAPESEIYTLNRETPSEKFAMPTYLNFGVAYDFYLDENRLKDPESGPKHRLTAMANFTSNSFNSDYIGGGFEYAFREIFMLRGGYRYENDITNRSTGTFYSGYSAGATVQHRIGEKGPKLGLDYSFRPTHTPANGVHTFSLRFMR
ncbi:MAG: hypothetical protein K0R82_2041 [Flavipsychrobacter sp.]|jgi:hypothetical protein|nr:hypothetical protein [Flavipsychrobacter sp.]